MTHAELARAGQAVVDQIAAWTARGHSAPARLLDGARGFVEWAHYPQPDAVDRRSGWRFYYHCHPPSQRLAREHGHFHILVPVSKTESGGLGGSYSHLIGLSVDARGLPLRIFTTNGWVTDGVWQPAAALERQLAQPRLHHAEPRDVALWLQNLLILLRPEITALLYARDRRLTAADPIAHQRRLDDRRLRMPSQRRIDLARQLSRYLAPEMP